MTKQEFKDTLTKYEDVINDLTNGLQYINGKIDFSISNCKDNCYIFLYILDDDIIVAEWSDDGKVIIYVYHNQCDEYIPEQIFETTEELDFWLSHNYIDDNKWEISDDVIAKYYK